MILEALTAAAWIIGIYYLTRGDWPLAWLRKRLGRIGEFQPVLGCSRCMSSLHGSAWFTYFHWNAWWDFVLLPFFVVVVFGIVYAVTNQLYDE